MKKATMTILFEEGNPEGFKIIEKSNWTGKAVHFPRSQFPDLKDRPEFNKTGVYLLLGLDENEQSPSIYIGEGDPILPRLSSHFKDKDFWTHAIIFCSKDDNLNKAHIQYIESSLLEKAKSAKRCFFKNGNQPTLPSLSEVELAVADNFLSEMLNVYSAMGIQIFEKPSVKKNTKEFFSSIGSTKARGSENAEGFLVFSGSQAVKENAKSFPGHVAKEKSRLIEQGVLLDKGTYFEFAQDYQFNSPSKASSLVLGRPSNGRIDWKDLNGKTLKEYQEEKL